MCLLCCQGQAAGQDGRVLQNHLWRRSAHRPAGEIPGEADLQSDRTLHYYTCTPPDLFMLTLIKVCVRSQTDVLSQCCSSRKSAKNMHGSGSGSGSTQARGPGTGLGYCVYL